MKIVTSERTIEQLNSELDALKAERNRLNDEAKTWADKRDKLHEEIQKMRLEVKGFRGKRDELNAEIQFIKTMKEERREKRTDAIEQLKGQRLKIKTMSTMKETRSSKSLEDKIAEIDWMIQTESHSLEEEKKLVDQVKALEIQLQAHKKIEQFKGKIYGLSAEAQTLKEEIKTDSDKILELAERSQKFHEKMIAGLEKTKTLRMEADENHCKYVESREKAKACHSKFVEKLEQVKALFAAIRQKEEEEKSRHQANLKKQVEDEALEKLKQGKKLSFDEFKILAEQGKI